MALQEIQFLDRLAWGCSSVPTASHQCEGPCGRQVCTQASLLMQLLSRKLLRFLASQRLPHPLPALQALESPPLEVCHQLAPAVTMLLLPWWWPCWCPGAAWSWLTFLCRRQQDLPAPRLLHWGKIVWSCCGGEWQRWLLLACSAKLIHT